VRYLQQRIAKADLDPDRWRDRTIGVLTGTSMGPLMPQVLAPLTAQTSARFDLTPLENPLFGSTVTTAGLLPGRAFQEALAGKGDWDLALLPAESVNDEGKFIDNVTWEDLVEQAPVELRLSHDFTDALSENQ
jgi:NifB/MoaA-like Fe-S oxidoreductase